MAEAPDPFAKPALPLTGGCFCGEIRNRIDAFPLMLYACHCTQCQCQTGSSFALNMPVAPAAFHIVQGAPLSWRRQSPSSGAILTSWFCGTCASRIYAERSTRPDSVNVRAGTLDDTTWLIPAAHVFIANAQPWERFDDASICYETLPADFKEIAARWRARLQAD